MDANNGDDDWRPATRRPRGRWSNLRLTLSNYPPLGITQRWRKTSTPLPCRLTTVPSRRLTPRLPSPPPPSKIRPLIRVLGLLSLQEYQRRARNTGYSRRHGWSYHAFHDSGKRSGMPPPLPRQHEKVDIGPVICMHKHGRTSDVRIDQIE